MSGLSNEQAYTAMFYFLERAYERTKWDGLGALLGSMAVLQDGKPVDSAIEGEWLEAVNFACEGGQAISLVLR